MQKNNALALRLALDYLRKECETHGYTEAGHFISVAIASVVDSDLRSRGGPRPPRQERPVLRLVAANGAP